MTFQFPFTLHRSPSTVMETEVGGALLYLGEGSYESFIKWERRGASNLRDCQAIAAAINLGRVHQSGRCNYS